MVYLQSLIAMDVARERAAEAAARSRRHRLVAQTTTHRPDRRSALAAGLARVAARASRGSADLAHRLDPRAADEVLAPEPCSPA